MSERIQLERELFTKRLWEVRHRTQTLHNGIYLTVHFLHRKSTEKFGWGGSERDKIKQLKLNSRIWLIREKKYKEDK